MLTSIRPLLLLPFHSNRKLAKSLVKILGFVPTHMKLYEMAFIHKSASLVLPDGNIVNNERLEYLGDAILDAIVADYLFRHYPNKDEGFLTKMRSKMVKRKHLNLLAIRLGIDKLMVAQTNPLNVSKHLYGNAFEALVGAVYLDKGYVRTSHFISQIIKRYVNLERLLKTDSDYKSQLIEWAQKHKEEIVFESREEIKAHSHLPLFITHVRISTEIIGRGIGNSKKDSEQKAARIGLERLLKE
ncbi:MAG: ribonuclease III [Bacteroidales bacterium]|nr:ribonuclease III [Bacteroidales bacterium]